METIELFIQAGLCWLIIVLFVKYSVIPIIEIFTDKVYKEPLNYQI